MQPLGTNRHQHSVTRTAWLRIVILLAVCPVSGTAVAWQDDVEAAVAERPRAVGETSQTQNGDNGSAAPLTGTVQQDNQDQDDNSAKLSQLLARFNRGAALMEQFRYGDAAQEFQAVLQAMPNWTAARFNLGLAYLNMEGEMGEQGDPGGDHPKPANMRDLAIQAFHEVLAADPDHIPATYCLGTLYEYIGEQEQALQYFERVYQAERNNSFAGYSFAKALHSDGQHAESSKILEEIVERDPGFVSAVHLLATQYVRAKQRAKAMELFQRFRALRADELAVGSYVVDGKYGMAGRYHLVVGADDLPVESTAQDSSAYPIFSPEVREFAAESTAWAAGPSQINIPCLAVADVDGDGDLDIALGGQDDSGRASLWLNDGNGQFSPSVTLGSHVISIQVGDIDNDGDVDLWLGTSGPDRLLLNDGAGSFTEAPLEGVKNVDAVTSVAGIADIDSDGDLDLFAMRVAQGAVPATPNATNAKNSVFFNNTDGTFQDRAAEMGLALPNDAIAAIVADDFDNDYDLDFAIFSFDAAPQIWENFRLGEYRLLDDRETGLRVSGVISATTGDPDKDGDRDLLVFTTQGCELFLNGGALKFQADKTFAGQHGRLGGTGGQFVDLDNDGDLDIVIADAKRRDGRRGPVVLVNQWPKPEFVSLSDIDAGHLLQEIETGGHASCVAADFTGNGRCDLLLAAAGKSPRLIENITPDGNWVALDLVGKRPQEPRARSSNSAIGARVEVKTGLLHQQFVVGGSCGPVASKPLRVHAGLGDHARLEWLRVIWPDAILQAELELPTNQTLTIEEQSRKPSSCPYLFVWDGQHFEFVGDFGGVGGLGYLVAPGLYASPDPTEYVPVRNLQPQGEDYVLQALTPLEEITYFDEAKLIAVDHPAGTEVHPNEMMAIGVAPPEFQLFCVRDPIEPVAAVNHLGQDIQPQLSRIDREYAGATQIDPRFVGLAEPHFVELDFGDQLGQLEADSPLILLLHGWVEYGYSSTNYAAFQAGQVARAPTIEVLRDGQWVTVMPEVGYPAGINHMMTIDVTGKIRPTDRRIRVSTNMELYWDRIYLAVDQQQPLMLQEVAARSADLHFRGYPREYSPDGKHPNLCDYENMDRNVAWKLMAGDYTRFGDVLPLVNEADDCFVIMGHGEELTLRFAVQDFTTLAPGMERTFILKTDSYCKDMDLYTAFPNRVEPLPFHAMSGYPYGEDEHYPDTQKTRTYREKYNTRRILPSQTAP